MVPFLVLGFLGALLVIGAVKDRHPLAPVIEKLGGTPPDWGHNLDPTNEGGNPRPDPNPTDTSSSPLLELLVRTCPVPGSTFTDTFGAPRSGGRTHEGTDMFAPVGTPIHAAHAGTFHRDPNTLGGIAVKVVDKSGAFTYYAHMLKYANIPDGQQVNAGQVIGYVDNTGDASSTASHCHFGLYISGKAVDAFQALRAVCSGPAGGALRVPSVRNRRPA